MLVLGALFIGPFGAAGEVKAAVSVTCAEFPIALSFSGLSGVNVGTASVAFVAGGKPSYSSSITKYKLRWVGTGTNGAAEYTHPTLVDATTDGPHQFVSIANGKLNQNKTYQFFLDPYSDATTRADAACVGSSAAQVNTSSTKLGVTQSASTSVASGATLATQPAVAIQNSTGTTVADDSTPVSVTISGGDGNGSLSGTTTVSPVTGVATFSGLGVNGTNGQSYTLTFTGGALTSAEQTGIGVSTGLATLISIVNGNSQRSAVSTAVATAPKVKVVDSGGNAVSGTSVAFAVATGGGTVGSASVSTLADGTASSSWTLGRSGGANSITASATGLSGSPLTFTATGTFSVSYKSNRGSGSIQSQSAAPTESPVLSAGGNFAGPRGLSLLSWNTSPFGTGTNYALAGTIPSMPSRHITLYAVWAGTLSFNGQGASSEPAPISQAPGNVTLPAGPLRPGKTFLGWATRPGGGGRVQAAGSSFFLGVVGVTLYAKWA